MEKNQRVWKSKKPRPKRNWQVQKFKIRPRVNSQAGRPEPTSVATFLGQTLAIVTQPLEELTALNFCTYFNDNDVKVFVKCAHPGKFVRLLNFQTFGFLIWKVAKSMASTNVATMFASALKETFRPFQKFLETSLRHSQAFGLCLKFDRKKAEKWNRLLNVAHVFYVETAR